MIHLQLLEKSYLVIYSNQDSICLCLKSCKVCLNGAVRAFHLAAQGPYPCCKGQLSNAQTVREIIKLTQLEPRLGSLPGLPRHWGPRDTACACNDAHVLAAWDISWQGEGEEWGQSVLQSRIPKRYLRPCLHRVSLHSWGAQGFGTQLIQDEAEFGLVSCYLSAFSLHWKAVETERFPLKNVQNKTFVALLPLFGGEKKIWKFTIYSILFRSKIFTLFYNLSQLEHIHKFFRVQTTMFSSSIPPEVSTYIGRYSARGIHNF